MQDSGFAGQRLRQSTRPDLREHAVCGLVGLAERHFLLLPTAGSLMSLGTLSADVHVTMPLKLSETTLEDDRASLAAMGDVCSWGWPCCLCGNFEFADTLGVHKQWRTGSRASMRLQRGYGDWQCENSVSMPHWLRSMVVLSFCCCCWWWCWSTQRHRRCCGRSSLGSAQELERVTETRRSRFAIGRAGRELSAKLSRSAPSATSISYKLLWMEAVSSVCMGSPSNALDVPSPWLALVCLQLAPNKQSR